MNAAEAKRYVASSVAKALRFNAFSAPDWVRCHQGTRVKLSLVEQRRIVDATLSLADELERRAFRKADG